MLMFTKFTQDDSSNCHLTIRPCSVCVLNTVYHFVTTLDCSHTYTLVVGGGGLFGSVMTAQGTAHVMINTTVDV